MSGQVKLPDSSESLPLTIAHRDGNANSTLRRCLANPTTRLLVVSACSASKRFDIADPLTEFELDDPIRRQKAEARLRHYRLTAAEMYTGSGHRYIRATIDALRKHGCHVSHFILSAGYGLLNEMDYIVPYNVTFNGATRQEIRKRGERLSLRKRLIAVAREHEQTIIILGREYLAAIGLPLPVAQLPLTLAYIAPSLGNCIGQGITTILISEEERRKIHAYSSSAKEKKFNLDILSLLTLGGNYHD